MNSFTMVEGKIKFDILKLQGIRKTLVFFCSPSPKTKEILKHNILKRIFHQRCSETCWKISLCNSRIILINIQLKTLWEPKSHPVEAIEDGGEVDRILGSASSGLYQTWVQPFHLKTCPIDASLLLGHSFLLDLIKSKVFWVRL